MLALLVCLLAASGGAPLGVPGHTIILADGVRFAFPLEHRLTVVGSDTVLVDGEILSGSRYSLDHEAGVVVFDARPPAWTVILVSYRYVPFLGPRAEFRLHRPAWAGPALPEPAGAAEPESLEQAGSGDITVSGDKSIGVSVGGIEGSGISQSTRLSVNGTLEGIGVEAELSDQSSGIPAEGTTREVDELDRIVIRLKGRDWQGSFGDVDLGLDAPGFGRVERRAVGALIDVRAAAGSAELGYARPRGQFGHLVLSGRDGVQGPYVLAPDQRQAQVVPASERVYLDGQRMTRGWDADYTIDYSSGEVVFTNRRVIDRYSRIEALFQYVVDAYERDDVLAGAAAKAGPVEFGAGVFREGDNPSRAYDEDLTEDERQYLAGIGADTSKAWLEGGRYVGPGNGSYAREPAGFYRYAGEKQGDYEVAFTLVGDSLGAYAYDDTLLAYRFAGEGMGDYVALRRAKLPEREEMVAIGIGFKGSRVQGVEGPDSGFRHLDPGTLEPWNPLPGVSASVNGVFRRRMLNLFAAGGAARQDGALATRAGWRGERFGLSYAGRFQAQGFSLPGQDSVLDFRYRWGGTGQDEMASTNELKLDARPLDNLEFTAEAGMLDRARTVDEEPRMTTDEHRCPNGTEHQWSGQSETGLVTRWLGTARFGWLSAGAGRAGDEARYELGGSPKVWRLAPRFGLALRSRPEEESRRASAGLGAKPTENLSLGADYRYDERDTMNDERRTRNETGGLAQVEAGWNSGEAFRADARLVRQSRQHAAEPERDWTQWLANLALGASPLAGVRLWTDLAQSYRLVQLRDEVFRYVGAGNGQYSRDTVSGRYYPDPDGDYERVVVALGRFASCRERNVSASAQVSAWEPLALSGSASLVSTADTVPLQEVESHSVRATLRQLEPVLQASLGTSGSRSMDRTLAATGRDTRRDEHYLELQSSSVRPLDIRVRVEGYAELRRYSGELEDFSEQGWRVRTEPVVGAGLGLELLAALGWAWVSAPVAYPELGRFLLSEREAGLARSFSIGQRARVRAAVGIVQREATVAELPYEVSLTRPLGLSPSAGLDFTQMLSDVLTATARYQFFDRPDRAAEHRLAAELRAYF